MRTSYFQCYNHLTLEERQTIARLYGHCKLASIALIISRSRATIKREIDRNGFRDEQGERVYDAERAHEWSMSRRKGKFKQPIIRGFYNKDRYFPKLWGSPKALYAPQFGRSRFDPWSNRRLKNEYRYDVVFDYWKVDHRCRNSERNKYRFRPLMESATDYRRKRRRFFFDYWAAYSNWEEKRTGRMRTYSFFRKKYYYIDQRRREGYRKKFPYLNNSWQEMPFDLHSVGEGRQQKEEQSKRLHSGNKNRLQPVFRTVFHKANQTLQGRGVSDAENFGQFFKNESYFIRDNSVLFRKSAGFH